MYHEEFTEYHEKVVDVHEQFTKQHEEFMEYHEKVEEDAWKRPKDFKLLQTKPGNCTPQKNN